MTHHGEAVITLRQDPATWSGALLDPTGATTANAMLRIFPWRSVLIGVSASCILFRFLTAEAAGLLGAVVVAPLCILEISRRQVYVTSSHLVLQSGLLNRKLRTIPLEKIAAISASYPLFGRARHVGALELRWKTGVLIYRGLREPEEAASKIRDLKQRRTMELRSEMRRSARRG
jgi:hypothetical protein